ncbi:hypothetical protein VTK73DRAFT_3316 [Phialemonium thermophilum]|uniref:Protamine P1 n=1 Tax=Phialemonium thermophilum TaxID=223376 RepID=A0ABR3Y120_9PEZI
MEAHRGHSRRASTPVGSLCEEHKHCETPHAPDDVLYSGSDDEYYDNPAQRRQRYEAQGQRYLQGKPVLILSAGLAGPFTREAGWENPWRSTRPVVREAPPRRFKRSLEHNRPENNAPNPLPIGGISDPSTRPRSSLDHQTEETLSPSQQEQQRALDPLSFSAGIMHSNPGTPFLDKSPLSRILLWREDVQTKLALDETVYLSPVDQINQKVPHGKKRISRLGYRYRNGAKRQRCGEKDASFLQTSPISRPQMLQDLSLSDPDRPETGMRARKAKSLHQDEGDVSFVRVAAGPAGLPGTQGHARRNSMATARGAATEPDFEGSSATHTDSQAHRPDCRTVSRRMNAQSQDREMESRKDLMESPAKFLQTMDPNIHKKFRSKDTRKKTSQGADTLLQNDEPQGQNGREELGSSAKSSASTVQGDMDHSFHFQRSRRIGRARSKPQVTSQGTFGLSTEKPRLSAGESPRSASAARRLPPALDDGVAMVPITAELAIPINDEYVEQKEPRDVSHLALEEHGPVTVDGPTLVPSTSSYHAPSMDEAHISRGTPESDPEPGVSVTQNPCMENIMASGAIKPVISPVRRHSPIRPEESLQAPPLVESARPSDAVEASIPSSELSDAEGFVIVPTSRDEWGLDPAQESPVHPSQVEDDGVLGALEAPERTGTTSLNRTQEAPQSKFRIEQQSPRAKEADVPCVLVPDGPLKGPHDLPPRLTELDSYETRTPDVAHQQSQENEAAITSPPISSPRLLEHLSLADGDGGAFEHAGLALPSPPTNCKSGLFTTDSMQMHANPPSTPTTKHSSLPTPDFTLSIKSFRDFLSPSPESSRRPKRASLLNGHLPSTQALFDAALSNPWKTKSRARRRVTFAPLPGEDDTHDDKDQTPAADRVGDAEQPTTPVVEGPYRVRVASPPLQISPAELPAVSDRFGKHFATVARKGHQVHRQGRVGRCLLPSESQQRCSSPAFDAMAEAFLRADQHAASGAGSTKTNMGSEGTPDYNVIDQHNNDAVAEVEDVAPSNDVDDVTAVLNNLDEFLDSFDVDVELEKARAARKRDAGDSDVLQAPSGLAFDSSFAASAIGLGVWD